MSRDEGFAVMDVNTSICDDPKFRVLQRQAPQHVAVAFTAYVSVMAESWRSGRRVPVAEAWPSFIAYDPAAIDALTAVGLLDRSGNLPAKTWRSWFEPARDRRARSRDRWARHNENRRAATASLPRGNDEATASSVRTAPSVPPVRPSVRLDKDVERQDAARRRPSIVAGYHPVEPSGRTA